MSNNKTLKVFSSTAVAGMIAAAMMSSQAFAAVDAYSVKVGNEVYKYDRVELEKSFLDAKAGEKAALYEDFTKKLGEAKGFYAFNDTKNGYVDYKSIEAKFLESKDAGKAFDVNAFTESKDAKVLEVKTAKKAVVNKDGKVEYVTDSKEDEKGELHIKEVKALNLKQVKIEFNKAVKDQDKVDDIEDESNYTIKDKDNKEVKDCVDKVELDKDKKFAIITFKDHFDKNGKYVAPKDTDDGIKNQETYSIEFDSNITGKEVTEKVKFNDFQFPEIESIKIVGSDSIKLKFSKPVKPVEKQGGIERLDTDDVKINDDNISVSKIELSNDNTEATVKLAYTLKDGKKIKVQVKGTIEDYAGYGVRSEEKELTVKKDEAKPVVVGYKDVKKGKATIVFNKDIKFDGNDSKIIVVSNGDISKDNGNENSILDKNGDVKEWSKLSGKVRSTIKTKELGLKDYYHTNDSNKAYAVKIDGRELTLYFNEDDNGLASESYINVKADKIKTLWNVKNEKIVHKVVRSIDNTKLVIKSIEQDENNAKKITVKFNKEVDKATAEKTSNYELKDEDGTKWSISSIKKDTDNNKKVILETSKKLDSGKYTLTIKDVEDVDGKAIEKSSKKFTAKERDARTSNDIKDKVSMYNTGKNDQKIVVDFDTKMKNNKDENSISNIKKYSLVAKNITKNNDGTIVTSEVNAFENGKSSILIDKLYNSSIKVIQNDHKAELTIPFKKGKDDSYDFSKYYKKADGQYVKVTEYNKDKDVLQSKHEYYKIGDKVFDTLEIHIGNVSDADENVNPTELVAPVGKADEVKLDKEDKLFLVRAISTDKIQATFDDELDFKNGDVFLTAGEPQYDRDHKVTNEILVSEWDSEPEDGKTVVTMTLAKNQGDESKKYDDDKSDHVLRYDGTFDGKKVYFNTKLKTESKNHYDAYLQNDVHEPIIDAIAPQLVDNNIREDGYKYKGNGEFGDFDNNDKAVEFFRGKKQNGDYSDKGTIVLTFTEPISGKSISDNSFILDQNSDYETVKIEGIDVDPNNSEKVVIRVKGLKDIDPKTGSEFGTGFDVVQNQPIADESPINRGQGNQVSGISTEIGNFSNIVKDINAKLNKLVNSNDSANKIARLTFTTDEDGNNKINANLVKPEITLEQAINVKDIPKELMPSEIYVTLKGQEAKKVEIAGKTVNEVKDQIVNELGKSASVIKLKDLNKIEVTINGIEYIVDIEAPVAPAAH